MTLDYYAGLVAPPNTIIPPGGSGDAYVQSFYLKAAGNTSPLGLDKDTDSLSGSIVVASSCNPNAGVVVTVHALK